MRHLWFRSFVCMSTSDRSRFRSKRFPFSQTSDVTQGFPRGLGNLKDELPEPVAREDSDRVQKRVNASFRGDILLDREDVLRVLAEIHGKQRRIFGSAR
jgi:hypothetical protein